MIKIDKVIVPLLSIHTDELYLYGKTEWLSQKPPKHLNSLSNLDNNHVNKKMSIKAKHKASRAIKYLLHYAPEKTVYNKKFNSSFKFKVGFITLTLPSAQKHSDQEIKSLCLNQFLIEAKKKWGLTHYVWKAEHQANGNLHFHILSDRFIPWKELREVWNRIINKLGYVDNFEAIHKKKNPNSTDIHSLWKIKNVAAYVTKYFVKPDKKNKDYVSMDNVPIENYQHIKQSAVSKGAKKYLDSLASVGRIWACSTSLSNLSGGQDVQDQCYLDEIEVIKKCSNVKVFNKEFVSCIYFDNSVINPVTTPNLYGLLQSFVDSKFGKLKQEVEVSNSSFYYV
jgi:hypothetical protein